MLHTDMQSRFLPRSFPPKSTVHDYLQRWCQRDSFRKLLERGELRLDQGLIDATFVPAKGGGDAVGLTRKGKGTKIQLAVVGRGIPLSLSVEAASVSEPQLVQQTLALFEDGSQPERLARPSSKTISFVPSLAQAPF